MISADFFTRFKQVTEERWSKCSINPSLYGFQFQRGTRWNPGLSDKKIVEYEDIFKIRFPNDLKAFLRHVNGTDLPTLNVYGQCGEPYRQSVGVYSYPRDIEIVRQRIECLRDWRTELVETLAEQGFALGDGTDLVPIYGHRYVVCTSNLDSRRSPINRRWFRRDCLRKLFARVSGKRVSIKFKRGYSWFHQRW
jgi:hypothetical protein